MLVWSILHNPLVADGMAPSEANFVVYPLG